MLHHSTVIHHVHDIIVQSVVLHKGKNSQERLTTIVINTLEGEVSLRLYPEAPAAPIKVHLEEDNARII